MSVTDGESEPVHHQPSNRGLYKTALDILVSLGLPQSRALSEHATHIHHEDVPDHVVVKAPNAAAVPCTINDSIRIALPFVHTDGPERLHPIFPPKNYGAVLTGAVYRSSYPQVENFEFLQSLKLKTILTLVDTVSPEYGKFMNDNDIQHFQVPILANKGEVKIQACQLSKALRIILDRSNHPMLIHCNKGKHRTGCVVGIIRRIQGYEDVQIWDEYHVYADDKARILDEGCIDYFDLNTVLWLARQYDWILPNAEYIPLPVSTMSVAKARP